MESALRWTCRFRVFSFPTSSPSQTDSLSCRKKFDACSPGADLTSSLPSPTSPFAYLPRSHPVQRLTDDSGVVVPSINNFSRQFPLPLEQKPAPRDLASDIAVLNHAARLAKVDVFFVTDDVADYFPHLSFAPTEYWFSTLATLLLPGDAGFSGSNRLAFVTEYVLGFGLLCASNYTQRLSAILLALMRVEFAHFVGQHNPASLASKLANST
eukprot:1096286-Pleurochrysis_carterae.AAC.1